VAFPPPRLFTYEDVVANLTVEDGLVAVEEAFGALARGEVDVPMPMHITVAEKGESGPGDCHIKGGYVLGSPTFTVKLATVSFYNNAAKGLPPGSGVFCVVCAETGGPLGIFIENRYMTDLRTGAAGGISLKYCGENGGVGKRIGFIGCGAIARNMCRASGVVTGGDMEIVAYDPSEENARKFAEEMAAELGLPASATSVVTSAEALCGESSTIFTQTPGGSTVLERGWLNTGATVIASGSDQPTKQELPVDLLSNCKYVSDLTGQTSKVGELRSAIEAGAMGVEDVHAELGEIVNGVKSGREGDEIIVVDLTGTGAQDAAIGQVAWDKLGQK